MGLGRGSEKEKNGKDAMANQATIKLQMTEKTRPHKIKSDACTRKKKTKKPTVHPPHEKNSNRRVICFNILALRLRFKSRRTSNEASEARFLLPSASL